MQTNERRQTGRHRVTFKVVYDGGSVYSTGTVRDVSETGAFVVGKRLLPEGSRLLLTPLGAAADVFELPARVVRVVDAEGSTGMGLSFGRLDREDRRALKQLFGELPKPAPEEPEEVPERVEYGAPIASKVRTRARLYAGVGAPRNWLSLRK